MAKVSQSAKEVLSRLKKGGNKDKGGGSKKYGRARYKCKAYRARGRRLVNKEKRLKRHLKAQPNDGVAKVCLEKKKEWIDNAASAW